jgi:hypothetical protein
MASGASEAELLGNRSKRQRQRPRLPPRVATSSRAVRAGDAVRTRWRGLARSAVAELKGPARPVELERSGRPIARPRADGSAAHSRHVGSPRRIRIDPHMRRRRANDHLRRAYGERARARAIGRAGERDQHTPCCADYRGPRHGPLPGMIETT